MWEIIKKHLEETKKKHKGPYIYDVHTDEVFATSLRILSFLNNLLLIFCGWSGRGHKIVYSFVDVVYF